jgi:hypothetical protein
MPFRGPGTQNYTDAVRASRRIDPVDTSSRPSFWRMAIQDLGRAVCSQDAGSRAVELPMLVLPFRYRR